MSSRPSSSQSMAALVAVALAAGCGVVVDDVMAPDDAPLRERLLPGATLAVATPSDITITARDQADAPIPQEPLQVLGGAASAHATADGRLIIDTLTIDLSDTEIPAGVIENDAPLLFTGLQLRLGGPLDVAPTWSGDGLRAEATGSADLLLDWALVNADGEALPLATQRRRDVALHITAQLDAAGRVTATVTARVDGPVFGFGLIQLSDFRMALTVEQIP